MTFFKKIDPHFGAGPCKKNFKISFNNDDFYKNQDVLGRGHRSKFWLNRIQELQHFIMSRLNVPQDYRLAFTAAGTTGAMEILLWNLLGERPVDIFTGDPFGEVWRHDIINELKIKKHNDYKVIPGECPPYSRYNKDNDAVFVYAGTPAGTQVPNLDWIPHERNGLTLCDAASGAFAFNLDWSKLDATAFSFQKALGSEAGIGAIILSPRAYERLQSFTPEHRPTPRLLRLKPNGKVLDNIFNGYVINTPSLLVFEDIRRSLENFPQNYEERTLENFKIIQDWVESSPYFSFLAKDLSYTSRIAPTILCNKFTTRAEYMAVVQMLEEKKLAYDINGHDSVEPCFRIWCGPSIEKSDLEQLTTLISQCIQ